MEAFVQKLGEKLKAKEKLVLGNGAEKMFSREEEIDIKKLYLMYEFSDKVRLLEDSPQYGSLQNYVENGLITVEEAKKAALI